MSNSTNNKSHFEEFEPNEECGSKEIGYIDSQSLLEYDPDSKFSPRMLSPFFLPSKRIPQSYLNEIRSYTDEELIDLLTSEKPLMAKREKVYTPEGEIPKPYTEHQVELYGSVALVDDRAVLDAITGMGSMFELDDPTVDLSDIAYFLEVADIPSKKAGQYEFDLVADALDPSMKPPPAVWYHVEVSELLKHLGLTNSNPNKKTLKKRLERLERMVFVQRFYDAKGKEFANHKTFRIIVDNGIIYLNNKKKLKNKKTAETFTDILVGISENYEFVNEETAFLSRKRLHQVYPELNKTSIMDFLKFLDENSRDFFHNKYLSWAVERYYNHHAKNSGNQNLRFLTGKLHKAVVSQAKLLRKHFNFELTPAHGKPTQKRYGLDYQIHYVPEGKTSKIKKIQSKIKDK